MLLEKDVWYAELVIHYAHQRTMHGGFGDILTCIHQNYWVLKDQAAVKKVIRNCTIYHR